jgi:hypothetical protein
LEILSTIKFSIRLKRGMEGDGSTSAQILFGKESVEGISSKTAGAHCHTQAWASEKIPGRSLRDTFAGQPRKISCG